MNVVLTTNIGKDVFIGLFCVIEKDVLIGDNVKIFDLSRIRSGAKIARGTVIGAHSQIEGECEIGENTRLHTDVHICIGAKIGDRVFIAPRTTLLNTFHPGCKKVWDCVKAPIIEDDVKIGANCCIGPGVRIGKGSIIGSMSNVIKDVPPYSLVVGNPAKVIKSVFDIECPFEPDFYPYQEEK